MTVIYRNPGKSLIDAASFAATTHRFRNKTLDAADDWIVAHIAANEDITITADITLSA